MRHRPRKCDWGQFLGSINLGEVTSGLYTGILNVSLRFVWEWRLWRICWRPWVRRVSPRLTTMSWKTLATRLLRYLIMLKVNLSLNLSILSPGSGSEAGSDWVFPQRCPQTNQTWGHPVSSGEDQQPITALYCQSHPITALYLLQVRALEIATDKSTINLKFLHPGSDPDSGHSSMTSAANSVFTSPLKKVR